LATEGFVESNHTATVAGWRHHAGQRPLSFPPSSSTEELIPVNKYQIRFAAAALAASFVNNANAATINNVASGSVAVIGSRLLR
jgi:hypothetical protein